ncbi:hypothetical protein BOX15_Mlig022103g2 [Macrostomum lignano]|uniref:Uncharacterized protein n=1 Tax=Macrostomum lignano TaxID=282301 RepID=A0A267GDR2_9PLAT|nr:hypothetical protein BOX15_Mlig022103g1 [Macrostomum lignano]PAA84160.1 hypothetical protein BOX15_Mlig022103g2 [Macrostomum lignano]
MTDAASSDAVKLPSAVSGSPGGSRRQNLGRSQATTGAAAAAAVDDAEQQLEQLLLSSNSPERRQFKRLAPAGGAADAQSVGNVPLGADLPPARLLKRHRERQQQRRRSSASPAGGSRNSEDDTSTYSSLGSLPSDFEEVCNNS